MTDEVQEYFFKKYEKAGFRVVPGHWPDFNSKEDVDKWIHGMEEMERFFLEKKGKHHVTGSSNTQHHKRRNDRELGRER